MNAITALRVRLATVDGQAHPALNACFGRAVVSIPLRAVPIRAAQAPRVAVCGHCGSSPDAPAARTCTAVRCPLVKTDSVHGRQSA